VIPELNFIILLFAVITAFSALAVKDLLSSIVLLSAFSFFMCLIWTEMGAVDVAFTEAAVGAGVSTAFFMGALYNTTRKTKD